MGTSNIKGNKRNVWAKTFPALNLSNPMLLSKHEMSIFPYSNLENTFWNFAKTLNNLAYIKTY